MSTGLYTHVTKAAGTIVDAPLYNTAHQNHLTNDIPTSAGANADTVTDFRATIDPAPLNVPAIVASIADELEQLRFVLADIKTALNGGVAPTWWYTPVTAPTTAAVTSYGAAVAKGAQAIPFDTQTPISFPALQPAPVWDTNGPNGSPFFSLGAPTELVVGVTGVYYLAGSGIYTPVGSSGPVALLIRRVSDQKVFAAMEVRNDIGSVAAPTLHVGATCSLSVGDAVELIAYQRVDSPYTLNNIRFIIQWLGSE